MSDSLVTLTNANFNQEVENFSGVVLVDFWAAWCVPCRMMAPILEQLAIKYANNPMVKIAKLDVDADDAQKTATDQGIMSLPTMRLFKNGEPVDEQIGATNINNLERMIEAQLIETQPVAA